MDPSHPKGGKAPGAGGTTAPGAGGIKHAYLSGWCNIAICIKENRTTSLCQGVDPKSSEGKEEHLKAIRNFQSTPRCEEQLSLAFY